jgi:hydrogenase maturation factor
MYCSFVWRYIYEHTYIYFYVCVHVGGAMDVGDDYEAHFDSDDKGY